MFLFRKFFGQGIHLLSFANYCHLLRDSYVYDLETQSHIRIYVTFVISVRIVSYRDECYFR